MDIVGMGERQARQFVEQGVIEDVADLYTLTAESFAGIEGYGAKRIQNLLAGIEASKQRPLNRLIFALGISTVGSTLATTLAHYYGSLETLAAASAQELEAIEGIGPHVAQSIAEYFSEPEHHALIAKLKQVGVQTAQETPVRRSTNGPLKDKSFVITGTLATMTREQAAELIQQAGGKVGGSVSKKTSFLVVGADPGGSKYTKAQQLGLPMLDEQALLQMLQPSASDATAPEQLGLDI
jgi:DNA ligase (NAD+)